jgi:hypothetical protein
MRVDDESPRPRHIRHLGDPLPGTWRSRMRDVLRADVSKARQFGEVVRDIGRWLHRQLAKRRGR